MNIKPDRMRKIVTHTTLPESSWVGDRLTVVLRVPPIALRPNGQHGHWQQIRKAKQIAKGTAAFTTRMLLKGQPAPAAVGYTLVYYFHSRMWDDDNAIASCKAYLDGISEAMGIDDGHLRFRELVRNVDRKCPRVEIVMHLK